MTRSWLLYFSCAVVVCGGIPRTRSVPSTNALRLRSAPPSRLSVGPTLSTRIRRKMVKLRSESVESLRRRARDPSIPDVIVDAEAKSNKQRPLRFAGYGLFGLYGLAVLLGNAGTFDTDTAFPLVFFESQPASLAIGALATGLSTYFYSTEVEQREKNIARIWEEVQRRKQAGTLNQPPGAGSTGTEPSQNLKRKKKRKKKKSKGFAGETPTMTSTAATKSAEVEITNTATPEEIPKKDSKGGLQDQILSGVRDMVQQSNVMAKAQAYQLNAALEDRGVLPKLNRTGTSNVDNEETA